MADKPLLAMSPAMLKALTAPMPNFHKTWREYAASSFRRDYLMAWAGDDPKKQRAALDLLNETKSADA